VDESAAGRVAWKPDVDNGLRRGRSGVARSDIVTDSPVVATVREAHVIYPVHIMPLRSNEIERLACDLENFRVERKASMSDKSKVEEAICAFANDLPGSGETGVILIGVHDKGEPAGLPITDKLLLALTSIRSDGNILPFPTLTVYEATLNGVPIAVIEVQPSQDTPLRLRGTVRVRVGPRRDIATRDEERILTERRRAFDVPFDQRPVFGSTIDELDVELFQREYLPAAIDPQTLAENGRSVPEQMASLHLASPDGIPTVTGHLMLGRSPTNWLPGAYVQFVRFDGNDLTAPVLDRRELGGPLTRVLAQFDDLCRLNIRQATLIQGNDREQRRPDYPRDALQQLLRNAVMHRNYETSHAPVQWYWFADRIEIHSPGGLFGRATKERFGMPGANDYRNPTLAASMAALGYVQKFGMGIPLARQSCQQNGNPEPEFLIESSNVAAIVRSA
jgi:ATP-dependent DNA helicase RecG